MDSRKLVLKREAAGNTKEAMLEAAEALSKAFQEALALLVKAAQVEQKNPAIDEAWVITMCLKAEQDGLLDTPEMEKGEELYRRLRQDYERSAAREAPFSELIPVDDGDEECNCDDCKEERGGS